MFKNREKFTIREIRILLYGFMIILLVVSFVRAYFLRSFKDLFDLLSYVMPCLAGVFAGGALYFSAKSNNEQGVNVESFYRLSVFLLFLGFVSYLISKPCSAPSIILIFIPFQFLCEYLLINRICARKLRFHKSLSCADWAALILTTLLIFVSTAGAIYYFPDLFIFHDEFRCYSS